MRSAGIPGLLIILLRGVGGWFTLSSLLTSLRGLRQMQFRLSQVVSSGQEIFRNLPSGEGSPVMNLTESTTRLIHSEKREDNADQ